MGITEIRLTNFTAFRQAAIRFSPGINALVGANSTGKTHLLKLAYTACDFSKKDIGFGEKLVRVFLPSFRAPGCSGPHRQDTKSRILKLHPPPPDRLL